MNTELIVIGNELLGGKRREANAFWLGGFLAKHCLLLDRVTMVNDEEKDLLEAIQSAFKRSDLTVLCGGLGPTGDDITKMVLARAFGKRIEHSDLAIEVVSRNYSHFERIPQFQKNGYANIPQDFLPIFNPCGLAPGLLYSEGPKMCMALPGVPQEFSQMFEKEFFPKHVQKKLLGNNLQNRLTVRTRNIPEEEIWFSLCPKLWDSLSCYGTVSSLPHQLGVDIGVTFSTKKEQNPEHIKNDILATIENTPLKPAIWQVGELPIEEYIILQAKKRGFTLGTIESCTGGMVATRLTDVAGASEVYLGSIVSYANEVKSNVAGVQPQIIELHGAVSEPTALSMAEQAREKLDADIVVSTTGIAGPSGGTPQKPVGTICIGISSYRDSFAQTFQFKGDREHLRRRFSQMALYLLLEEIERS